METIHRLQLAKGINLFASSQHFSQQEAEILGFSYSERFVLFQKGSNVGAMWPFRPSDLL
jgi:hypothetical protein